MSAAAIAAIIAGVLVVGAIKDRMTYSEGFKKEQHKEWADPSKHDN